MKSEIISVGTELLLGNIVNTNAQFLSDKLAELGIDVYYHTVVGDNPGRLRSTIELALSRSDMLVFTGGLGPTEDDLTKEIVCETLGIKQVLDTKSLNMIKDFFKKINVEMTENNIKQAFIPEGSTILTNEIGTAPGVFLKQHNKIIILLPGPPREMKLMFEKYAYPLLKQNDIIKSRVIKTIGIGESSLEFLLKDIIHNQTNPTIATYAKEGQVDIRITAKGNDEKFIDSLIDETISIINKKISGYIYSYNDETIEEVVYRLLKEKNMKIAFCESCTGGLISSRFTRIPGVSEVFDRGIVTYSNEAKIEELGVNKKTLEVYGAVSENTAIEMARGLLAKTKVDIAISTTGIAGPSGGTISKPVGLVYIGISTKENTYALKCNFTGARESIQNRATNIAFNEARKYLLNLIDWLPSPIIIK